MPIIKLYLHGVTSGVPPTSNSHQRALRSDVGGWSHKSTRANTAFLRSVEVESLSGRGYGITLTVRDCPPSGMAWASLRNAFIKRLKRVGLVRIHWVTEWQRRGVPHLHGAVWFPESMPDLDCRQRIAYHWLLVAEPYGAKARAQHVLPITGPVGWFKYLAKHASRGLHYYQRSASGIPPGWQGRTGRMWGYGGDWPTRESMVLELEQTGFVRFRRMVRAWRVAHWRHLALHGRESQRRESLGSLRSARRMLRCTDPRKSAVRGVSEWLPLELQLRMVELLAASGSTVVQRFEDQV